MPKRLTRSFFNRSVHEVAPDLIGATLLVDGVGGRLVEVEAYHHTDPAAHSFRGPTGRNAVMFGPPGYAYVYRSYGIHWCLNFVCEPAGLGQRRADPGHRADGRPLADAAAARHQPMSGCCAPAPAGSARRCASLTGITAWRSTRRHSSSSRAPGTVEVVAGPRIGITKAVDLPWRYGEKGSRFFSKPFTREA